MANALYAGGTAGQLRYYDGNVWGIFASPSGITTWSVVSIFVVNHNSIFISVFESGGTNRSRIYYWDGAIWTLEKEIAGCYISRINGYNIDNMWCSVDDGGTNEGMWSRSGGVWTKSIASDAIGGFHVDTSGVYFYRINYDNSQFYYKLTGDIWRNDASIVSSSTPAARCGILRDIANDRIYLFGNSTMQYGDIGSWTQSNTGMPGTYTQYFSKPSHTTDYVYVGGNAELCRIKKSDLTKTRIWTSPSLNVCNIVAFADSEVWFSESATDNILRLWNGATTSNIDISAGGTTSRYFTIAIALSVDTSAPLYSQFNIDHIDTETKLYNQFNIDGINDSNYTNNQFNISSIDTVRSLNNQFNINEVANIGYLTANNVWNHYDEYGLLLGLQRITGETNWQYKRRLLDVFVNRSNSTYNGLINSITRELGLSFYYPISINPRINLITNEFLASDPLIEFNGVYLNLYSDHKNDLLDYQIDRYQTGNNYETLINLVNFINTTTFFEASFIDTKYQYNKSNNIINQTNIVPYKEQLLPSTKHKLKYSHLVNSSVYLSDRITFARKVTVINKTGDYTLDYTNGLLTSYSTPSIDASIEYKYIEYPFNPIASQIVLYDINDSNFKVKLFEQILQYNNQYTDSISTELGNDLINELLSLYPNYWGV